MDSADLHALWEPGTRRVINRAMRESRTAEDMARRYPHCAYFIQQILKLFYDDECPRSLTRDRLESECSKLYRGLHDASDAFESGDVLLDGGFQLFSKQYFAVAELTRATSKEVDVQPVVVHLAVESLPRAARFLSFNEEEILLLPGKIVLSKDIKGTGVRKGMSYEVNTAFVDSLLGMDLPVPEPTADADVSDGGAAGAAAASSFRKSAVLPSKIVPESLGGTYLVYYRAIHGRPAEVLTWRILPENPIELTRNVRYYVPNRCDSHVYTVLPYIPEYRDMEARYKKGIAEGPDQLSEYMQDRLSRRMASYEMHAAVYDPAAKRVITMNLATPRVFFRELYPELYAERLEEAHDAIVAHFAELGDKAPRFSPVT